MNVKAPIYFICSKDSFDFPNNQEIIDKYGLELKTQSIPGWIEMISDWHGKRKKNEILLLYGKD